MNFRTVILLKKKVEFLTKSLNIEILKKQQNI